jgi:glycine/D-amino acid oxidase-like deaminating enzyme
MRVAVIGAGLLGAATARELQSRGAQVTVYEAAQPGTGTSGTSFAWINSRSKEPRAYHDLNVAGMRAHADLAAGNGAGPQWYFPAGSLEWATGPADAERLGAAVQRLESWGYRVDRISRREASALEPDIRIPDAVDHALSFPAEGFVLPVVLIGRLLGEAADRGAELCWPARVEAVEDSRTGVALHLADGTVSRADAAICCVGRWTTGLAATAGYSVPLADPEAPGSATVGFLGYTPPIPARISRVLMTPRLNVRPDGGGRLVIQGLDLDEHADPGRPPSSDGTIARQLAERLAQLLPRVDRPALEQVRVGQRALPADGLTVAGYAGDGGRLYILATHSGVTLSPLLGRLAASEVLNDAADDMLAPFRPGRLLGQAGNQEQLRPARLPGEQ